MKPGIVIILTLSIVCVWVYVKSNKLSSRVVAYEQEYAILERDELSDIVSQIEKLQVKKREVCDKIKSLDVPLNENDILICGKE